MSRSVNRAVAGERMQGASRRWSLDIQLSCFRAGLMTRRCVRTMRRSLLCRRYWIVPLLMVTSTFSLLHVVLSNKLVLDNFIEEDTNINRDFFIGPCLIHTNTSCPDDEITFFLYTRKKGDEAEQLLVNDSWSNLEDTNFRKYRPTKIIVHGYNSDMQLDALVDIKNEYMKKGSYNIIAVDWHRLAAGPCYPIAVQNVPHVGKCLAQLVQRLRYQGANNIHIIGFSLGAHIPAYSANSLRPYKLSRITGLDPALPLFVTVSRDHKLDASDARFVDVFHTNAFIQGKIEMSGHIDFYINGGINQPGCWRTNNPFGCSHHRSAEYFAESINSKVGFWGWPCPNFFTYLLGLCPPRFPAVLAGENVHQYNRGFHLLRTNSQSPFAQGFLEVDPRDKHK